MTYESIIQELDGLIDSLDEHVTTEDVGLALGALRANVIEMAKPEKAHAPTDAETAWIAWKDGCVTRPPKRSFMAGWEAALRRSEVPEPQGESSDDYEAGYAEGFHHGVSSPRGSAEDDREQGECCDAPGGPERCGDCPLDRPQSQGEPSDAQVQAALDAYHDTKAAPDWRGQKTWRMRAALREAGKIRLRSTEDGAN